jgi:2,3-bisphosphoglycerate-dependent phosphoglycerate mutase
MTCSEKLNERDYGDLVGLNKQETADKFGKDQVHIWRRSYDTPPPNGESLKDVVDRVSPYFKEKIKPFIDIGENILIAAHGNSLRAMMIELEMYKPEEISSIELPTGSPLCINLDQGRLINFKYLD